MYLHSIFYFFLFLYLFHFDLFFLRYWDIKVRGMNHEDTVCTILNLGNVYSDLNELESARSMYQAAFEGFEKLYGETTHPHMVAVLCNFGNLTVKMGDSKGAVKLYEWALNGYEVHSCCLLLSFWFVLVAR